MTIAEGEYAGLNPYALINPGMTLTPGFADFAFTPWDDMNLTYLSTEGDVVGDMSTLVTGVAYNEYTYASLNITTTDLVNVEDPDDQLLPSARATKASLSRTDVRCYNKTTLSILASTRERGCVNADTSSLFYKR